MQRLRRHGASHLLPLQDGWRILLTILRERTWRPSIKTLAPTREAISSAVPDRKYSGAARRGTLAVTPDAFSVESMEVIATPSLREGTESQKSTWGYLP